MFSEKNTSAGSSNKEGYYSSPMNKNEINANNNNNDKSTSRLRNAFFGVHSPHEASQVLQEAIQQQMDEEERLRQFSAQVGTHNDNNNHHHSRSRRQSKNELLARSKNEKDDNHNNTDHHNEKLISFVAAGRADGLTNGNIVPVPPPIIASDNRNSHLHQLHFHDDSNVKSNNDGNEVTPTAIAEGRSVLFGVARRLSEQYQNGRRDNNSKNYSRQRQPEDEEEASFHARDEGGENNLPDSLQNHATAALMRQNSCSPNSGNQNNNNNGDSPVLRHCDDEKNKNSAKKYSFLYAPKSKKKLRLNDVSAFFGALIPIEQEMLERQKQGRIFESDKISNNFGCENVHDDGEEEEEEEEEDDDEEAKEQTKEEKEEEDEAKQRKEYFDNNPNIVISPELDDTDDQKKDTKNNNTAEGNGDDDGGNNGNGLGQQKSSLLISAARNNNNNIHKSSIRSDDTSNNKHSNSRGGNNSKTSTCRTNRKNRNSNSKEHDVRCRRRPEQQPGGEKDDDDDNVVTAVTKMLLKNEVVIPSFSFSLDLDLEDISIERTTADSAWDALEKQILLKQISKQQRKQQQLRRFAEGSSNKASDLLSSCANKVAPSDDNNTDSLSHENQHSPQQQASQCHLVRTHSNSVQNPHHAATNSVIDAIGADPPCGVITNNHNNNKNDDEQSQTSPTGGCRTTTALGGGGVTTTADRRTTSNTSTTAAAAAATNATATSGARTPAEVKLLTLASFKQERPQVQMLVGVSRRNTKMFHVARLTGLSSALVRRYTLKARSLMQVESDHVQFCYGVAFDASRRQLDIVLEYLPESSLVSSFTSHVQHNEFQVASYALQLLSGIRALHNRGLWHMNIKPSTVFVDPSGTVKIGRLFCNTKIQMDLASDATFERKNNNTIDVNIFDEADNHQKNNVAETSPAGDDTSVVANNDFYQQQQQLIHSYESWGSRGDIFCLGLIVMEWLRFNHSPANPIFPGYHADTFSVPHMLQHLSQDDFNPLYGALAVEPELYESEVAPSILAVLLHTDPESLTASYDEIEELFSLPLPAGVEPPPEYQAKKEKLNANLQASISHQHLVEFQCRHPSQQTLLKFPAKGADTAFGSMNTVMLNNQKMNQIVGGNTDDGGVQVSIPLDGFSDNNNNNQQSPDMPSLNQGKTRTTLLQSAAAGGGAESPAPTLSKPNEYANFDTLRLHETGSTGAAAPRQFATTTHENNNHNRPTSPAATATIARPTLTLLGFEGIHEPVVCQVTDSEQNLLFANEATIKQQPQNLIALVRKSTFVNLGDDVNNIHQSIAGLGNALGGTLGETFFGGVQGLRQTLMMMHLHNNNGATGNGTYNINKASLLPGANGTLNNNMHGGGGLHNPFLYQFNSTHHHGNANNNNNNNIDGASLSTGALPRPAFGSSLSAGAAINNNIPNNNNNILNANSISSGHAPAFAATTNSNAHQHNRSQPQQVTQASHDSLDPFDDHFKSNLVVNTSNNKNVDQKMLEDGGTSTPSRNASPVQQQERDTDYRSTNKYEANKNRDVQTRNSNNLQNNKTKQRRNQNDGNFSSRGGSDNDDDDDQEARDDDEENQASPVNNNSTAAIERRRISNTPLGSPMGNPNLKPRVSFGLVSQETPGENNNNDHHMNPQKDKSSGSDDKNQHHNNGLFSVVGLTTSGNGPTALHENNNNNNQWNNSNIHSEKNSESASANHSITQHQQYGSSSTGMGFFNNNNLAGVVVERKRVLGQNNNIFQHVQPVTVGTTSASAATINNEDILNNNNSNNNHNIALSSIGFPMQHTQLLDRKASNVRGMGLRRGNYFNYSVDGSLPNLPQQNNNFNNNNNRFASIANLTGGLGGFGKTTFHFGGTLGSGGKPQQQQQPHSPSQMAGKNNNNNNNNAAMAASSYDLSFQLGPLTCGKLRVGNLGFFLARNNVSILHAVDEFSNRQFIVKRINVTEQHQAKSVLARVRNEATLLTKAMHPDVVRCYAHFFRERDKMFILLMESVPGRTLESVRKAVPLTEAQVASFTRELVAILSYLHYTCLVDEHANSGIAHLDIKPQNVILMPDGHIKLIDFGEARRLVNGETLRELDKMTPTGTTLFMPPEQFDLKFSFKADVWAVGCFVIYMVLGKPCFLKEDQSSFALANLISSLAADQPVPLPQDLLSMVEAGLVSAQCEHFIRYCLTVDHDARPTSLDLMNHPWINALHLNCFPGNSDVELGLEGLTGSGGGGGGGGGGGNPGSVGAPAGTNSNNNNNNVGNNEFHSHGFSQPSQASPYFNSKMRGDNNNNELLSNGMNRESNGQTTTGNDSNNNNNTKTNLYGTQNNYDTGKNVSKLGGGYLNLNSGADVDGGESITINNNNANSYQQQQQQSRTTSMGQNNNNTNLHNFSAARQNENFPGGNFSASIQFGGAIVKNMHGNNNTEGRSANESLNITHEIDGLINNNNNKLNTSDRNSSSPQLVSQQQQNVDNNNNFGSRRKSSPASSININNNANNISSPKTPGSSNTKYLKQRNSSNNNNSSSAFHGKPSSYNNNVDVDVVLADGRRVSASSANNNNVASSRTVVGGSPTKGQEVNKNEETFDGLPVPKPKVKDSCCC